MTDPTPVRLVTGRGRAVAGWWTALKSLWARMLSWWAAIHEYAVPELDAALAAQASRMAHMMFGGLTHEPAIRVAQRLPVLHSSSPHQT